MTYFQTIVKNVKEFWSEINAATLTGAIDVLVIEQEDGTFLSSPFHVRFGKLGVLKSKEKIVDLEINGESVNIFMKLDDSGAAYFVEEVDDDVEWQSDYVATSPIPDQSLVDWVDRRKGSLVPVQLEQRFQGNDGTPAVEKKPFDISDPTTTATATYTTAEVQTDPAAVLFAMGQPEEGEQEGPSVEPEPGRKGKLNRKKRRRRSYMKHSRNGSKTNMKDIVEQSEQDGMFLMEDVNDADLEDDDQEGLDSLESTSWSQEEQVVPDCSNISKEREPSTDQIRHTHSMDFGKEPVPIDPIPHTLSMQFADSFNYDGFIPECEPSGSPTPTTQSESLPGGLTRTDSSDNDANLLDDTDSKILNDSLIGSRVMGLSRCTSETDYLNAIIQGEIADDGLGYSNVDELRSKSVAPGFHYFSDQEEGSSPMTSRPCSPVLSDSEFEKKNKDEVPAWKWGELPSPVGHHSHNIVTQVSDKKDKNSEDERKRSSSWWSWGEKRKGSDTPGIRLDDLTKGGQVDPELAAIYLSPSNTLDGRHVVKIEPEEEVENNDDPLDVSQYDGIPLGIDILKDEDAESGRGPSLPMSPHGGNAEIGGPCRPRMELFSSTSEAEEDSLPALISRYFPDFGISFCGPLDKSKPTPISPEMFAEHQFSYSDFASKLGEDPSLLSNASLVVRLQERYMTWEMASPLIVSVLAFKMPLPYDITDQLTKESLAVNMSKTPEDLIQENKEQIEDREKKSSSWLSGWWGAKEAGEEDKTEKSGIKTEEELVLGPIDVTDNIGDLDGEASRQDIATQTCDPMVNTRKKRPELENSTGSSENDSDDSRLGRKKERKFKKTLRLTPDMIKELNLKSGSNEIQFSVTTAFQGTTKCKCHIFLWKHTSKIVISDIDGTITKSDVLGHILPVIGKDWAQSGVAQLFNKIKNNGYHIMYLSARAIGQATVTKEYLQSVRQGDLTLPDGPLFLNPESLIQCFRKEVIDRNPEEFKIACLRDIQTLFGGKNPFFAGYGNRTNDAYAYRAVGIPISRIFTINPAGELRHELTQNFQTSYNNQSTMVDHVFPSTIQFDPHFDHISFSAWSFWRNPITELDTSEMELILDTKTKK